VWAKQGVWAKLAKVQKEYILYSCKRLRMKNAPGCFIIAIFSLLLHCKIQKQTKKLI
jgi:hypothetical protein